MIYKIKPKSDCSMCHGSGECSGDWVPYGSTNVQLPATLCDCVIDQLPEVFYDKRDEVEICYDEEEIELDKVQWKDAQEIGYQDGWDGNDNRNPFDVDSHNWLEYEKGYSMGKEYNE
jgi:hypothetical protein